MQRSIVMHNHHGCAPAGSVEQRVRRQLWAASGCPAARGYAPTKRWIAAAISSGTSNFGIGPANRLGILEHEDKPGDRHGDDTHS